MNKLKQQFKEFRSSTPEYIQWLLLGAAFIVVIILLTLILGHKSGKYESVEKANQQIVFKTEPNHISLKDVKVGSSSNARVDISVNTPVMIKSIDIDTDDITIINDCEGLVSSCIINVIYKPKSEQSETNATLDINWYIDGQPDIVKTQSVSVVYNSFEEKTIEEPQAETIEPEPEPEIEPEIEPEPMLQTPVEEIREIAQPNPFIEKPIEENLKPEKCSEFAIAGFDQSGRQIGWIKPERGANYFHPFSDKDCSNPTGKYDFTTGIITSLKDGAKIGTDSDHIGYRNIGNRNLIMPALPSTRVSTRGGDSFAIDGDTPVWADGKAANKFDRTAGKDWDNEALRGSAADAESVISSRPYDRTFILRQFKPIPATIVSEVRADPSVYGCKGLKAGESCDITKNYSIPVRATVDRNVYSDDGRTIILPTGTLLLGYLAGDLPGPYQSVGRMNIRWYQFIRPDGVEFNFPENGQDPYSADAQGRMGVPGHGSTDYVEQMVMPILTALVPAAVNMISPIADTVINQIDLDNNTVVQSGTIRSSEMAKQEVINAWNQVAQKLLVDAIDNTVPPFSIAAGTRINVFSPVDLIVTCGQGENDGKKCAFAQYGTNSRRQWSKLKQAVAKVADDGSWVGQVRSFDLRKYCQTDGNGKVAIGTNWAESGYDYRTVYMYCESQNYQAINNAKQDAYYENLTSQASNKYGSKQVTKGEDIYGHTVFTSTNTGNDDQKKAYNTEVLGLTYDEEGNIINPFAKPVAEEVSEVLTCEGDISPDINGCCPGETYTDMGEQGFNCCPDSGGDCFPPLNVK